MSEAVENWRCSVCKGRNIQRAVWANPNTGEIFEDYGDHDEHHHGKTWCADCEDHTELQLYEPIPHAIGCDMDEDCTCGAEQADRVVGHLQDELDGVHPANWRFEAKLDDRTLGAFDKLHAKLGSVDAPIEVRTMEEYAAIFGSGFNRPGGSDGDA